jgi:hypothetical protein
VRCSAWCSSSVNAGEALPYYENVQTTRPAARSSLPGLLPFLTEWVDAPASRGLFSLPL